MQQDTVTIVMKTKMIVNATWSSIFREWATDQLSGSEEENALATKL